MQLNASDDASPGYFNDVMQVTAKVLLGKSKDFPRHEAGHGYFLDRRIVRMLAGTLRGGCLKSKSTEGLTADGKPATVG